MKRGVVSVVILAVAALAGCQERYLAVDDVGRTTATPPPATPPPPTAASDTCGAGKLQYLIGKSRLQIPVPVNMAKQRVDCTTCVLSHLDDPQRVTILFDQATGLVTDVRCQ